MAAKIGVGRRLRLPRACWHLGSPVSARLGWVIPVLLGLIWGTWECGFAWAAGAGPHSAQAGPVQGLNPLESWKADLALWTAVVFVVLLFILWKYAWGPIVHALQQREQTIADQIAQAQRQHQEAQSLLAEYQQKLAQSQQEIQQMLEEARRQAEQTSRDILQQAHQQAEADRQKMLQDIQRAKQQALREIAAETANLAVLLAGKILQVELQPDRHRQLIQQTLAQWQPVQTMAQRQSVATLAQRATEPTWSQGQSVQTLAEGQTPPSSGQRRTPYSSGQRQTAPPASPSDGSQPSARQPGAQPGHGDSPQQREEPRG